MAELVDAADLKSVDLFGREGSSPSFPNNFNVSKIFRHIKKKKKTKLFLNNILQ